jgi:hypothetical protein
VGQRAYLYSVDFLPSERRRPTKAIPLLEWGGRVSFCQALLIGSAPVVCPSVIFKSGVALAGDLRGGIERYKAFLARLAPYRAKDEPLAKALAATEKAIAETTLYPVGLLEVMEVVGDVDGAEELAQKGIPTLLARSENASESYFARRAAEWQSLGLGDFGALYFTLPLAEPEVAPAHGFSSDRVKGLFDALSRAEKIEKTTVGGARAVRMKFKDSSQVSVLSDAEYEELRKHFPALG